MTANVVSVIIVVWNELEDLRICVEALRQQTYTSFQVVVVDNGSKDGSREWALGQRDPSFDVIDTGADLGFCRAANIGIRATKGEFLLNLSPDVILDDRYLEECVRAMDSNNVGLVGGKLLRRGSTATDEPPQIDSAGHVARSAGRVGERGNGRPDIGQYDFADDVIGVTAAAALFRRAMIDEVSYEGQFFDEDFWAYKDDVDVCWRARHLGWRIRYVPAARAWHRRGFIRTGFSPKRRRSVPSVSRFHSFRNRYLVLAHNATLRDILPNVLAFLVYELIALFYVLLVERELLAAYPSAVRRLPRALSLRRDLMRRQPRLK